ncbi:MAG: hypothetical protein ACK41D_01605 [Rubricoccaceae bacterium]
MQAIPAHSQCTACAHLERDTPATVCSAFPSGIPDEIWLNEVPHTTSYPGDNGIMLELIPLEQYRPQDARA